MQAVVKTPHIEITGENIPKKLLDFLKKNYKNVELIDDEEEYIDITQTDWFRQMAAEDSPAEALKRYRKRFGMSQIELGEKLNMLKQNVSAMERGTRGISKATAHKLAEIFHSYPGRFI